jgi:hypothetical protein
MPDEHFGLRFVVSRISRTLTCLGCFSSKLRQKRHPERSASQIYHVTQRLVARSRRTPKALILPMLFEPFRPRKPENSCGQERQLLRLE